MINLYFVRHAESEGNINKLIYSEKRDCDVELSENGKVQATTILDQVGKVYQRNWYDNKAGIETYKCGIWYSPYVRAIQTKDIVKNSLKKEESFSFEYMNVLLREREWGDLQELSNKNALTDYFFNFYHRPKDGESFADVYQRVVTFHQLLLNTTGIYNIDDNIIIAHGELLKVYMMFLLNWSIDEFDKYKTPRNAQVYRLYSHDMVDWKLDSRTPLIERHK